MLDFADELEAEIPATDCIDYGFLVCFFLFFAPAKPFAIFPAFINALDSSSACVVAIIRIVTMMPFIHSNDFTWFKVTIAKWWYVSHSYSSYYNNTCY